MSEATLTFTNNWFDVTAKAIWDQVIPTIRPVKILEIGSYEGASACYLIQNCGREEGIEIYCVDTWEGASEHRNAGVDMSSVEARFRHNVAIAQKLSGYPVKVVPTKGRSDEVLPDLLSRGMKEYFDLVYVDGSHEAPDVLTDAVLSFALLKVGGHIIFDDYLWRHPNAALSDALDTPKPAIDSFLNLFYHKLRLVWSPNSQVVARRTR